MLSGSAVVAKFMLTHFFSDITSDLCSVEERQIN